MNEFASLLSKLESEKWSGEVEVTSTEGSAVILIHQGYFLWAHRSLDRSIERFSRIGWIELPPDGVLKSSRTWEELVRALVRSNQAEYHRLVRYLKTERLEIFYRIFFWSNVEIKTRSFLFELPDPVEFGFYTRKRIANQIKEAEKRIQEWPRFQKLIGSSKRIFLRQIEVPTSEEKSADAIDQALGEDEVSEVLLGGQSYTPEEMELIRLCDGTHNVQDLIRISSFGEFLTIRRVIHLWDLGAIAPKDEEATVYRRAKSKSVWSLKAALFAAFFLALITSACFVGVRLQMKATPLFAPPTALQQRLEIFRRHEGRYPLNLQELSVEHPLDSVYLNQFQYKLLHPLHYELVVK
jgi:hypothetical protein